MRSALNVIENCFVGLYSNYTLLLETTSNFYEPGSVKVQNPLCTDHCCVAGGVFLKADLEEDETFAELSGTVSEQMLIDLLMFFVHFNSTCAIGENRL